MAHHGPRTAAERLAWSDAHLGPASPGFGETLRRLRRERGLSQAMLADRVGVEPSAVSRYESGARGTSRRVHIGTLANIADALDLTDAEWRRLVDAAAGRATRR
jgi:transcriptional regulator with XRE-family HTH domain